MNLYKHEINRRGSASWLLCNDNSKSNYFRNKFISEHGGNFQKDGKFWTWTDKIDDSITNVDSTNTKVKTWVFEDANGIKYTTTNLTEFCKTNNLSRAKIYELINKTRNSHKGYKFLTIENPA